MFTDLVGFTALGQRDEAKAVRLLEEHRSVLKPVFAEHEGHVVKTLGDGFLVQFPSAVESVLCAQRIQLELAKRKALSDGSEKIALRIGIHVGDVIQQNGDILGDAANVASRLESLADPGGICISEQVVDQIRNKIAVAFHLVTSPILKNVEFPIRVHRLESGVEGTRAAAAAPEARSYVRVAVLPFTSLSPDPSDEFFADGLTEEVITCLSRGTALRVIARTSIMQYKGARRGIRHIGRGLGVGSILEGSVRRSAKTIRISVQLIDADTEEQLWSNNYDRVSTNVLAVQDEIAQCVASVLQRKLVASIPPGMRGPVSSS